MKFGFLHPNKVRNPENVNVGERGYYLLRHNWRIFHLFAVSLR